MFIPNIIYAIYPKRIHFLPQLFLTTVSEIYTRGSIIVKSDTLTSNPRQSVVRVRSVTLQELVFHGDCAMTPRVQLLGNFEMLLRQTDRHLRIWLICYDETTVKKMSIEASLVHQPDFWGVVTRFDEAHSLIWIGISYDCIWLWVIWYWFQEGKYSCIAELLNIPLNWQAFELQLKGYVSHLLLSSVVSSGFGWP